MLDTLRHNFSSPLTLSFALGVAARLLKSEFSLPRDVYAAISIYLLFALGLKGGVELSQSSMGVIFWPAIVTLLLGCITPVTSYVVLRRLGRFSVADAAGLAAHYGSVSAVTFLAAQQFATALGQPLEGFLPTLLTLLESPGIHIALAIGAIQTARADRAVANGTGRQSAPHGAARPTRELRQVLHEVLTARSMILLVGGLLVGVVTGESGYEPVKPFFEGLFKGALTIFLLEMGIVAGSRLGDLRQAGAFLIGFGIVMPILHGALAVVLGHWAGLSIGGCTVLAAMASSASYIAAPPAVRMTLPEANPTYYLTASLAITFPFNLLAGIPLYYQMAKVLHG
ncbi:MAG: sodium-dependent bicarbonate transport family permease [Planctomycetia bacterium]|nr:sodium-dependent bicarbonate transport family permease [Planctomycetia bacterium]